MGAVIEEANWHRQQIVDIAQQMRLAFAANGDGKQPGAELQEILKGQLRSGAVSGISHAISYARRVL